MRLIAATLVAATLSTQQSLSDAEVLTAIKAGESNKFDHLVSDCVATAGFGESMGASLAGGVSRTGAFTVTLSTAPGRIAYMAARGKRLYKPVTLSAITDDMRAAAVVVSVEPHDPSRGSQSISVAAPIEHIVLKSKAKADVIAQPTKVDTEPVEWSNLMGGTVAANRAVAFFEFAAVKELPAGEFDIVVVTTSGERRCKVGTKDRQKLFAVR